MYATSLTLDFRFERTAELRGKVRSGERRSLVFYFLNLQQHVERGGSHNTRDVFCCLFWVLLSAPIKGRDNLEHEVDEVSNTDMAEEVRNGFVALTQVFLLAQVSSKVMAMTQKTVLCDGCGPTSTTVSVSCKRNFPSPPNHITIWLSSGTRIAFTMVLLDHIPLCRI